MKKRYITVSALIIAVIQFDLVDLCCASSNRPNFYTEIYIIRPIQLLTQIRI